MTKRDYLLCVENLGIMVNQAVGCHDVTVEQARACASHFAHAFAYSAKRDNPRFDADKFYDAVEKATGARMCASK